MNQAWATAKRLFRGPRFSPCCARPKFPDVRLWICTRLISAPNLNLRNFAGPTEARYERMSERDEIARERELQKDYERI